MEYILIPNQGNLVTYSHLLLEQKVLAIDSETTGLSVFTSKMRLLQIATYNNPVIVIDMFNISDNDRIFLQELLKNDSTKVFQNAKFDLSFLKYNNYIVNGAIFDTMIAGRLLRGPSGPFRVNLAELTRFYLGETLEKDEQTSDFSKALTPSQLTYAAKDAYILLQLKQIMQSDLASAKLLDIAKIEFSCINALVDLELSGIKIDKLQLANYREKVLNDVHIYLEKLNSYIKNKVIQQTFFGEAKNSTINFNSQKQVLKFLQENGIAITDTSTSSLALYSSHPIIITLKKYRKAHKLYSGFLDSLPKNINPKTNRIHASYSQIGASSGRMSCHNPNMQQMPRDKKFRKLFIPEAGNCFIIADYSQVELRIAAEISKDTRMINAYANNEDLHKLTAALITNTPINDITKNQRQAAKAVNFGLVFGMGSKGLQAYSHDIYNISISLEQADMFRNQFFKAYSGIKKWHDHLKANPPSVARSLTGRRYFYTSKTGFSSFCNTPVQGSAADLMKAALGDLHKEISNSDIHIIAVIHDEVLLECPIEKAKSTKILLKNIMENAGKSFLKLIPLVADVKIASSWAEK